MIKKILFIILLCFLAINTQGQNNRKSLLETIEDNYNRSPNTATLAKYLNKSQRDIQNIDKPYKRLKWAIKNNRRGNKKKHVLTIKNSTEALLDNCVMAYKYAEKVTKNVKISSAQTKKIFYIKKEIRSIAYAAKYLLEICDLVINKPRKLTPKKFNTMVRTNFTLREAYNKMIKKTDVLLDIALIESKN